MKKTLIGIAALCCVASSSVSMADGTPFATPRLYFQIGGGEPVRDGVTVEAYQGINIGSHLRTGLSCDLWDQKQLLDLGYYRDMIVEYTRGQLDALGQQIIQNLQNAVIGIAVGTLQRAMPGLYDYSQNLHAQLSGKISVAKTSCEAVAEKTRNNANALAPWLEMSDLQSWKDRLGATYDVSGNVNFQNNGTNVLRAQSEVAENQGRTSIDWFHGEKRGGEGDPPINLVEDSVEAAYRMTTGTYNPRTSPNGVAVDNGQVARVAAVDGAPTSRPNRLGELWDNSEEASDWARYVLGEQTISFCQAQTCQPSRQPGAGLLAAYHEERETLAQLWRAVLQSYGPQNRPNIDTLRELSDAGVRIHFEVVDILMGMLPQDRSLYVERLISDAAISRTVEKGMALRRLIKVASQAPVVSANEHAQKELAALQDELKTELDEIKWELDLQNSLTSNVAAAILGYRDAQVAAVRNIPIGNTQLPTTDQSIIFDNGIPRPANTVTNVPAPRLP